jgi:HAD superfamily hydrolase (TIGR01484 family)
VLGARDLAGVDAVFTDLDGTLTSAGKLRDSTYRAVCSCVRAGVPVVLVSGRPAGWGEAFARIWPLAAVITENGGVTFLPGRRGLRRIYAVPPARLPALRRKMHAVARLIAHKVPGARLSSDSVYTEVNLAIDWNEEVKLPEAAARRIEQLLRARGYSAVRSSVHVNFWPGRYDKLSACRRVARELFGSRGRDLSRFVYAGDALNDEPMFAGFPRSCGVANVRAVWDELGAKPAFVTRGAEGAGFEEIVRAVLRGRRARKSV